MNTSTATKTCPRCKKRGKTWVGDAPKCAFPAGVFTPDNWNCATMNALRSQCCADEINYNEDQRACLLTGVESLHVLLTWYKNRGRTEGAWAVDAEGNIAPLTLAEAELIIGPQ